MHWIQTIRENLELTQNELAGYLQLSVRTIQSMEQGRRELPFKSMRACITLYNAMQAGRTGAVREPRGETDHQAHRQLEGLLRRCRHRLVLAREKLQQMQQDYENACRSLLAYELLADALAPDDLARLKWTEWRIAVTLHRIKQNNATAQGLLSAEIAALESRTKALEHILVADNAEEKKACASGHHHDTGEGSQKSGNVETTRNNNAKTPQPKYVHLREPVKRVEQEPAKPVRADEHPIMALIQVNRAGPGPGSGHGGIGAPKASFPDDTFSEGHNHPINDTGAGNNEVQRTLRFIGSHHVARNQAGSNNEPVNSG